MTRPISPREQRLIALLILTALVAAAYLVVVAPVVEGFRARGERLDRLRLTYAHNVRTIATIPRLRREAEAARAASASFTASVADVEAGREVLKDRLQRTIASAGGAFREAADAEGAPGWARVHATARMTLPQVMATLAALQNQPPWIVVDTVDLAAGNAIIPNQSPILEVEIEASVPLRPAAAR